MLEQVNVKELLTPGNLITGFLTYAIISFLISLICAPKYPTSIPWVGHGKGWYAGFRNVLSGFTQSTKWVKEGYELYNRNGKSFVLPAASGLPTEIVIPRSQMKWLLDLPDTVVLTTGFDILHGDYSFLDPELLSDAYQERVLHLNVARNLHNVVPDLADETAHVIDNAFGTDNTQWKRVNLMHTLMDIVPKLNNRMIVGKPLCRNQAYIDNVVAFTHDVVRNMFLFGITPKSLKSIIGPIAGLPAKYRFYKLAKQTYPTIEKRLEDIKRKDAGENTWEEPCDYLTWMIRTAQMDGRSDHLVTKKIAQTLLPVNFAATHTTSLAAHAAFLDILSTDPKAKILEALREEAETVFQEEGHRWTKIGLARMYKMDSAIRESMRLSFFAQTLVMRKVIAIEGVTNPKEGWHAPLGTFISCPLHGAHMDSDLHHEPEKYDPFRYSREREQYETKTLADKDIKEGLKLRSTGIVTTSDQHLPFGHGRHACPARFFVACELKLILAYLLMNYDIKRFDTRPEGFWLGRTLVPPANTCIEVRRKSKATH